MHTVLLGSTQKHAWVSVCLSPWHRFCLFLAENLLSDVGSVQIYLCQNCMYFVDNGIYTLDVNVDLQ